MSRKSNIAQSARHVMINDDDWALIQQLYGRPGGIASPIGVSKFVQTIVQRECERIRRKMAEARENGELK